MNIVEVIPKHQVTLQNNLQICCPISSEQKISTISLYILISIYNVTEIFPSVVGDGICEYL